MTELFDMRDSIINPKSTATRIVCATLNGNAIYGRIYGTDDPVVYDLESGVIGYTTNHVMWCNTRDYRDRNSVTEANGRVEVTHIPIVERKPLTDLQLKFVLALANQQLGADDVIKGLKVYGVTLPYKVKRNFLGGYYVEGTSEPITIGDMLSDFMVDRGSLATIS